MGEDLVLLSLVGVVMYWKGKSLLAMSCRLGLSAVIFLV